MVNSENKGFLILFEPGKAETVIEVGNKPLTIGRSRYNDIRLQDNGVSKRHATIRSTERGWIIADLGSTNGTQLNGKQLPAHKPFPWRSGQIVRIAKFEFEYRLNPLASAETTSATETDPSLPLVSSENRPVTLKRSDVIPAPIFATKPSLKPAIRIKPASQSKTLSIGEYHTVQVEISNDGEATATISLAQEGLPLTWITMPYRKIQLDPGQTKQLTVALHPPATELSQPGRYDVVIRAIGENDLALAKANLRLLVSKTGRLQTQIKPNANHGNRRGQLLIHNSGQETAKFHLSVSDTDNELSLGYDPRQIVLQGREKCIIDYKLNHSRRPLLGRPHEIAYALTVQGPAGQQHHNATCVIEPIIPVWFASLAAVLMMMLFLTGLLVVNNWELFNEQIVASLASLVNTQSMPPLLNSILLKPF